MDRPGKVTAASVILFVLAPISLAFAMFGVVLMQSSEGSSYLLLVGLPLLLSIGYVVLGAALMQERPWARAATIGLMAIGVVAELAIWLLTMGERGTLNIAGLVLPLIVIALVTSADARQFFALRTPAA
ncbi:MAG: hypothetical protein ACRDT4_01125 [Micromonosporaceae bacterium]